MTSRKVLIYRRRIRHRPSNCRSVSGRGRRLYTSAMFLPMPLPIFLPPMPGATVHPWRTSSDVGPISSACLSHIDSLDILINNAGISGPSAAVEDVAPEAWDDCIAVNLSGAFYVTRRAVPLLKKARERQHHQYVVICRAVWHAHALALCGQQVGTDWADQDLGDGARAV